MIKFDIKWLSQADMRNKQRSKTKTNRTKNINWFVINMFFPLPLRAWMIESILKFISQLPQIKRILKLVTLLVEASNISQTLNLLKILFCSLRLFLSLRFFLHSHVNYIAQESIRNYILWKWKIKSNYEVHSP